MSPVTAAMAVRMAAPLPAFCAWKSAADAVIGSAPPSCRQRADDVGGAIGRAVVDDDDLLADGHRAHALDQLARIVRRSLKTGTMTESSEVGPHSAENTESLSARKCLLLPVPMPVPVPVPVPMPVPVPVPVPE